MLCWATIGAFRPDQISARSARTSAIALLVSSALLLANAKTKSASIVLVSSRRHDRRRRGGPELLQDGLVGLAVDAARPPGDLQRAHRVDALAEGLGAHRDTGRDDLDVGDAGHRADRREVGHRTHGAVDGGRPAHHRGPRAGTHVEVQGELLAAGDDVAGVDAALRRADERELRLGLRLGGDRRQLVARRGLRQRSVRRGPALRP